jgi:UDP-N-acetylglucosamine diphosphorylase / glucose-1-phosphate thymidylyltransferase / UDP-N-acetylgalactosamine diphosphorylase / glucosamine-1-phosphate N-acetyltransferase / galactosamine-1-phosphate N-acetyltransferase
MLASDFFTLPASLQLFARHFPSDVPPWEWLKQIGPALSECSAPRPTTNVPPHVIIEGPAWIDPSVRFVGNATLIGPVWLGANTEVRPGAYVRGNVIVGEGAVLGNSCEFKNCLIMDRAQVPHFSYVGDSILGNAAHLGAGVICSNLRLDQRPISIHAEKSLHHTGLRKLGAILGDRAEVGCNAVLQPGTLLGKRALVLPLTAFAGYLPAAQMAYHRNKVATLPRRD